ncbi:MAG: isoprenyl transferase [Candidatus Omnitrophota bacterium]|nr:MAG: isoprenyl transferase [Candidatus Omnitrophota bacterium]
MDGNGRWAKERGLPRSAGHRAGIARVKEIVREAKESGIKVLTLFAFSTENWLRPKKEVNMLMKSLANFLDRQPKELMKNNTRLKVIGRGAPLPKFLQKKIENVEKLTHDNTGLTLVLALNYGSRQEIVDAAKKFSRLVQKGQARIEDLDAEKFSQFFYTQGLPDPDLLIRTSGEFRISNFLLWQISYTELYFIKKYWPDFKIEDFKKAIEAYQERERRYGALCLQKE